MNVVFLGCRIGCLIFCVVLAGCNVWRGKEISRRYLYKEAGEYAYPTAGKPLHAQIHYLGCGGFLLEYGGEIVLLDPYFSNLTIGRALLGQVESDTALINAFFKKRLGAVRDTAGKISTILISHAHHDHLADVPALLSNNLHGKNVSVYGSNTVVNLLNSYPALLTDTSARLIDLELQFLKLSSSAKERSQPQISSFFYSRGRNMRFAVIPTDHAGHFQLFTPHKLPFTTGSIDHPYREAPRFVWQFKEGQNFNYLIDLLDGQGKPVFRIFSNAAAACDEGVGYPPEALRAERPVDLLLLCGANYNIAKNYPLPLLEYLRPPIVWVAHWENFFRPVPRLLQRPEVAPNTNIPKLIKCLENFSNARGFPKSIIVEQPLRRVVRLKF